LQDIETIIKMNNLHLLQSFIAEDKNFVNWRDDEGNNLLAIALDNNVSDVLISYLIDLVDFRDVNSSGISSFDIAIQRGRIVWVKKMVERGVDVNTTHRESNFTPLMEAVTSSHKEIVKYLIEQGANIEQRDSFGFSAIDFARKMKKDEILELLKEYGAGD